MGINQRPTPLAHITEAQRTTGGYAVTKQQKLQKQEASAVSVSSNDRQYISAPNTGSTNAGTTTNTKATIVVAEATKKPEAQQQSSSIRIHQFNQLPVLGGSGNWKANNNQNNNKPKQQSDKYR